MELLSPSGSYESFIEAVNNGANAVYLGLKSFNARKPASNFSLKEYERAREFAKRKNVKIYVTLNIDFKPNEFEKLFRVLEFLSQVGIDAVIVKDFGLIDILKRFYPNIEFHLSTQFGTSNSFGIKECKKLGATRVILARELNYEEIIVCSKEDLEIEIFAQGSMCFSFSGRCYLSSWVGGKSANRGSCQAPCRLKYSRDGEKGSFFSMKDLNLIDEIAYLKKLDIASLKIEGRLKNPKWVGDVTKIYREALEGEIDSVRKSKLSLYSGRDQATGFVKSRTDLTSDNKKEFGRYIGTIVEYKDSKFKLDREVDTLDKSLRVTNNGIFQGIILEPKLSDDKLYIFSEKEFPIGSKVYEVVVASNTKKIIPDYKFNLSLNIDNGKLKAIVSTKYGSFDLEVKIKKVVKASRGVYLSNIENILLEGISGYRLGNLEMDQDILVSKSQINNLVKDLTSNLALHIKRNRDQLPKLSEDRFSYINKKGKDWDKGIPIIFSNINTIRVLPHQIKDWAPNIDRVIIDRFDEDIDIVNNFAKRFKGEIILSIFPILFENEFLDIKNKLNSVDIKISTLEINDISQFGLAGDRFSLIGGIGFSPFNQFAADFLLKKGLKSIHISQELDKDSLKNLSDSLYSIDFTVYSRVPLFYSRVDEKNHRDGSEFKDRIGTEMVTSNYRSITSFESKEYFSIKGIDLSEMRVKNLIADLKYSSSPESDIKRIKTGDIDNYSNFNLGRRLD
ncbi:MAG: hypothetical protein CR982_02435 [Candidatus Cloacimonadota bacterium]|nr:MAG: hypothetical protein CR982_02435 [Candidatus Cloacimonadota bacterium]PIE78539.1 MAG: hypothetical protein CSA15_07545 [Candidatus Delongbacteria bacterium]